jgi:hypothetical protein
MKLLLVASLSVHLTAAATDAEKLERAKLVPRVSPPARSRAFQLRNWFDWFAILVGVTGKLQPANGFPSEGW